MEKLIHVFVLRRYNVEYPKLYVSETDLQSKQFNCKFNIWLKTDFFFIPWLGIQRGHQNTLEAYPEFLLMLGLGSIKYPVISSIGGVIWLLGKIAFFQVFNIYSWNFYFFSFLKGYATGQPEKRRYGSFAYLGLFTMMGCAVKSIYDLIRA